ncbi:hypothetical protein [Azospirillum sp. TSH58]|uniref:hypothetical protein n=1 Tax=Azospirillum sp. TSH58 TaxID=664962 RepID=UPI0013A5A5F9|nr:hypothetical protein [Azospirillum sp. TSH58]
MPTSSAWILGQALIKKYRSRPRQKSHTVNIDFSGSRIVANFCTLNALRPFNAAKNVKTRLWDLKVDRDRSRKMTGIYLDHELFVFRPSESDPNYTDKQLDNIAEALHELEKQADQEEIRIRPLSSVKVMAQHILMAEQTENRAH